MLVLWLNTGQWKLGHEDGEVFETLYDLIEAIEPVAKDRAKGSNSATASTSAASTSAAAASSSASSSSAAAQKTQPPKKPPLPKSRRKKEKAAIAEANNANDDIYDPLPAPPQQKKLSVEEMTEFHSKSMQFLRNFLHSQHIFGMKEIVSVAIVFLKLVFSFAI